MRKSRFTFVSRRSTEILVNRAIVIIITCMTTVNLPLPNPVFLYSFLTCLSSVEEYIPYIYLITNLFSPLFLFVYAQEHQTLYIFSHLHKLRSLLHSICNAWLLPVPSEIHVLCLFVFAVYMVI